MEKEEEQNTVYKEKKREGTVNRKGKRTLIAVEEQRQPRKSTGNRKDWDGNVERRGIKETKRKRECEGGNRHTR